MGGGYVPWTTRSRASGLAIAVRWQRAAFYGRIMTADGVMVLAGGEVFDRQDGQWRLALYQQTPVEPGT